MPTLVFLLHINAGFNDAVQRVLPIDKGMEFALVNQIRQELQFGGRHFAGWTNLLIVLVVNATAAVGRDSALAPVRLGGLESFQFFAVLGFVAVGRCVIQTPTLCAALGSKARRWNILVRGAPPRPPQRLT